MTGVSLAVARARIRVGAASLALAALLPLHAGAGPAPKGPFPYEALAFRSIGPAAGGRVTRVAGVAGDPLVYYFAAASGGVWKSSDGGIDWEPIFDDQPTQAIGAIAVAPSDPNVVYVGSGEANIRGNVAAGNGLYRSLDAGKTWTHVWKQEGQIGELAVHPRQASVAFAAVLGHAFGPNAERGVYRTTDTGRTWQRVLGKDADTGASSVAFDPSNPNVLFAGLWQARRRPWTMTSGGPGSGLYVSRDGGDTWTQLEAGEHGLPDGVWGKVGVAVAPSDGRRVYALIEADEGGLYRSDDGGESWRLASGHRALRQRAWYYSTLTVDPRNPDVVWFPQVPLLRTRDGGATIERVDGPHHGDHHDAWIDPLDPRRIIVGNDGGVDISRNGGESWSAPLLPISQFYHVSADDAVPYNVMGAMQDLGTAAGPSNSLADPGIRLADWLYVGGGEAGHVVAEPGNPDVIYAGEYGGYISRYDRRTGQARHVGIYPENPSGHGGEHLKYRFQWTAPIATSPHDPKVVYHAGNVLFRSRDGGQTWTALGGDLTRNDKSKQKWSGGPITGDNTGVEIYGTLFAVAESPRERGVIWVGSDDGLVHVTRDDGRTWTNVTPRGLPDWATVSLIEPSPFDAASAYLVVDAHRLDDMRPYLWKTSDYGRTWKSLTARLPSDVYLHAVREDPARRGQLYLGTERGVMLSHDDGATWQRLDLGLPRVAVHDLVVKGDDLVLGTHGRSLWILDDLTPWRQMRPEILDKHAHVFDVRPAVRRRLGAAHRSPGTFDNPPVGVVLHYFLKAAPEAELRLEIRDAKQRLVRTLTSTPEALEAPLTDPDGEQDEEPKADLPSEPGVQRVVWDLRWEGARRITNAKLDAGDPRQGPLASPGTYTARLIVGGQTLTTSFELRPDARVPVAAAELEQQLEFSLELRDAITRLSTLVERLRLVRRQVRARLDVLAGRPEAHAWRQAAQALVEAITALEERLHNPNAQIVYDILAQQGGAQLYSRLAPLLSWSQEGDGAPTQGLRETFADQRRELEAHQKTFDALLAQLNALNALGAEQKLLTITSQEPPNAAHNEADQP
jgi:photosystem II stability/assembly factor-like uncharacterized protein